MLPWILIKNRSLLIPKVCKKRTKWIVVWRETIILTSVWVDAGCRVGLIWRGSDYNHLLLQSRLSLNHYIHEGMISSPLSRVMHVFVTEAWIVTTDWVSLNTIFPTHQLDIYLPCPKRSKVIIPAYLLIAGWFLVRTLRIAPSRGYKYK